MCYFSEKQRVLLFPNGCCRNGLEFEGNCVGNGWDENTGACCWVGNFCVRPDDAGGICDVDENGALPNIELFKPDEDVGWPIMNNKI